MSANRGRITLVPKKVDAKVAVAKLKQVGAIPLEPFTGSNTKWRCRCKSCGKIIYPRYSVVQKGHHPCGDCGRLISGAKRRKLVEKEKVSVMKRAGLIPQVEYPGTHKPWKSKCIDCKKIVFPHYVSVAKGSGCIYCAGRRVDETDVRNYFKKSGYEPIGPYPGTKQKWKARHKPCGSVVYPEYSKVKQGRGCPVCSGNLRVSEANARKLFLKNYLSPIGPFVNSQTPWKSKCLKCGKTVNPNYSKVKARGHQCAYCAGNKVDIKDAISFMKKSGFIPKAPYPGGNAPWKMQCKKCRRIVSPNYSSVKAGTRCKYCAGIAIHPSDAVQALARRGYIPQEKYPGADKLWQVKCKNCKRIYKIRLHSLQLDNRCAYCVGIKVDAEDVYKHLKKIQLKPLEKYKDAKSPIKSRCMNCLRIVSPSWSHIKNKLQGCAYCSKRRVDLKDVMKIMSKARAKPLEPFKNTNSPWMCLCLKCRKKIFPRFSDVKQGQRACIYCAGRKTDEKDAVKLAQKLGFAPLVRYPGANRGWKCRCVNCNKTSMPRYTTMQQRGSICKYCANSGFDFNGRALIYLITNKSLGAHKIGVAGASSRNERLAKHRNKGWVVVKTKEFRRGEHAFGVEQRVLYWLRIEKNLQAWVSASEMPQGGSSETVDAAEIDPVTIWRKVEEFARLKA